MSANKPTLSHFGNILFYKGFIAFIGDLRTVHGTTLENAPKKKT